HRRVKKGGDTFRRELPPPQAERGGRGPRSEAAHLVEMDQPPSPVGRDLAATGPTMRSKSACGPGLPWIGTCCATSSFNRLTLLNRTTAFSPTFWRFPPCGGGE